VLVDTLYQQKAKECLWFFPLDNSSIAIVLLGAILRKTFSVEEQFLTVKDSNNNNWIKLKLSDGNWNNNAYNNNNYVRCIRWRNTAFANMVIRERAG